MLPVAHRIRRSAEFHAVIRRGARAGRRTLVVHLLLRGGDDLPRFGFVVSRAVGPATVRNRVQRRLRHLVAARLDQGDAAADRPGGAGALVVVRALPAAARAGSPALKADLDSALDAAWQRARRQRPVGAGG